MAVRTIGVIMNGVTGRMGMNQHLIRSIVAYRTAAEDHTHSRRTCRNLVRPRRSRPHPRPTFAPPTSIQKKSRTVEVHAPRILVSPSVTSRLAPFRLSIVFFNSFTFVDGPTRFRRLQQ